MGRACPACTRVGPGVQQLRGRRALRRRRTPPPPSSSPPPALSGGVGSSASFGWVTPPTPFLFCLSPFAWVPQSAGGGTISPRGAGDSPYPPGCGDGFRGVVEGPGPPPGGAPLGGGGGGAGDGRVAGPPPARRTPRRRRRGNQVGHPRSGRRHSRPSARVTDKGRRRRGYFFRRAPGRAPVPHGRRSWRLKSRQPARGLLLPRRRAGGRHRPTRLG